MPHNVYICTFSKCKAWKLFQKKTLNSIFWIHLAFKMPMYCASKYNVACGFMSDKKRKEEKYNIFSDPEQKEFLRVLWKQMVNKRLKSNRQVCCYHMNITSVKFTSFWLDKPSNCGVIVIHAEKSSQSKSGWLTIPARRFVNTLNRPGDVITYAVLYQRRQQAQSVFSLRLVAVCLPGCVCNSEFVSLQSGIIVFQACKYMCIGVAS